MNMEDLCDQLTSIPSEILLLILNKLTNNEVLYSLIGVNIRLDNIASDPIFTEHLTLMERSMNGIICSLDNSTVDRFCSEILPRIHRKIKWLDLESLCMERILLASDYSNLHGLSLFNIDHETVVRLFDEETDLDRIFKNQILELNITMAEYKIIQSIPDIMSTVCAHVLSKFNNLICLKFHPYSDIYVDDIERVSFKLREPPRFFSSSLMELHINVEDFTDCLYLLDGRFRQLHTFYVNVHLFVPLSSAIINQEELINLKCFSLSSNLDIMFYEISIVPLLHRMSNLEKLFLNLPIGRDIHYRSFIDGNNLKKDIINHMPKLKKFVFSIHSIISDFENSMHLPSNEDIQLTFKDLENDQIMCYVDYFPKDKILQCHMYSQPYTMNYLYRLTNNFPGGLFKYVQTVSLIDEHPFEHEFFIRIAQSFPFLKILIIDNQSPQYQQSNENHRNFPAIEYSHLDLLSLFPSHDDYIEQFLIDTKTCLSNSIRLNVNYYRLQRITNNFTRDATRINCAKVKYIYNIEKYNLPTHFYTYFPYLEKL